MWRGQIICFTDGWLKSKIDFRHYFRLPLEYPAVFAIFHCHKGVRFEPPAAMGQNSHSVSFISLKIIHYIGSGDGTGTTSQRFLVYTALIATEFNRSGTMILPDKINVYASGNLS